MDFQEGKIKTLLDQGEAREYLTSLSHDDFQELGAGYIAYIREVSFMGQTRYVVYGADGEQLSVLDNLDNAFDTIHTHDMEAVTLQ